jgi:predicted RNase H-like HicB family nuclease
MEIFSPLRIEMDQEEDGRWLASVPELPGVMAYGDSKEEATRKAKSVALVILADMIDGGEELPPSLAQLFRSMSIWRASKARQVL